MGAIEYRLLGSVSASRNGETLTIERRHARAVMTLLLLERGKVVAVEWLVEALWPERVPGQPRTALQGYVSALRRTLGAAAIETRSGGYVLQAEPGDVDAERFAQLVHAAGELTAVDDTIGAESLLNQALDLWGGPALADFAYDAWAQDHARRLEELRLVAVEQLNDIRLELGEHRALLPELEALVREEPLRERLCEQYMLALVRSGRQADALTAYHDLRHRLADEIGIDPAPALRALYRRVLRQDEAILRQVPTLTAAARHGRAACRDADALDADVAFAESWATSLRNFEPAAVTAVADRGERLVSAFEYAIETGAKEAGARLLWATWPYWFIRGAQQEADGWAQAILALPGDLRPESDMEAQAAASEFARVNGDYRRAVELKQRARVIAEEHGLTGLVAGLDADLAHLFIRLGDLDLAAAHAERALELRRGNPNDPCGVGHALVAVGDVHEARGNLIAAVRAYEEAVADQEGGGFVGEAAYTRAHLLGRAHRKCGNTRAAYAAYRRALDDARPVDDYGTVACALQGLAWVAATQGDQLGAVRLLAEASRDEWQRALDPEERSAFAADVAGLRCDVPKDAFEAAWRIGVGHGAESVEVM